jgi:hypothetical protein
MLPAAGNRYTFSGTLNYRGFYGGYWRSSMLSSNAWKLYFYSGVPARTSTTAWTDFPFVASQNDQTICALNSCPGGRFRTG